MKPLNLSGLNINRTKSNSKVPAAFYMMEGDDFRSTPLTGTQNLYEIDVYETITEAINLGLITIDPGYVIYTALMTQTGTNDPVLTELSNTTGVAPTASRDSSGTYLLNFAGYSTGTVGFLTNARTGTATLINIKETSYLFGGPYSAGTIRLDVTDVSTSLAADGIISNTYIEIKIYP